jgi:osmotically inducible protein OsmC
LLAAAEAACFSMALSGGLDRNGTPATRIETSASCTIEKVGEGFKVTGIKLVVRATVATIADAAFQQVAKAAKEGCPVSGALKGNVTIDLEASLG